MERRAGYGKRWTGRGTGRHAALATLLSLLWLLSSCSLLNPTPTAVPSLPTPSPVRPVATATKTISLPTSTQPRSGTATPEPKVRPFPISNTPRPNPNFQKGGEYRFLASAFPSDMSLWEGYAANLINGLAPLHDTLLEYNAWEEGKSGHLLPNVAYDFYTDASGQRWTFLLRKGMVFHDGVEVTCADVEFMLRTVKDGKDSTGVQLRRSPREFNLRRVKEVTCPDPHTVVIVMDGPLPSLPSTLALGAMVVLPRHVFEGHLDKLPRQLGPGMGPFRLGGVVGEEGFTLVRNAGYWNQPYPYLERYAFMSLGSTQAVRAAFQLGRGEYGTALPPDLRQQMEKAGVMRPLARLASDGGFVVQANWKRAPWNDPRFSLALRCAIDSGTLIEAARSGEEYESPVFPLASLPGGSEWALTEEEWMAVHPCHGPSAKTDVRQRRLIARDLLAEMGFSVQNPAKPRTFLWDTVVVPQWPAVLADLEAVGITPATTTVDAATGLDRSQTGEFDVNFWALMAARADPDTVLYDHYHSTGTLNHGRYASATLDALIDEQSRTLDPEKRRHLVKDASRAILKDNAKIWAYWFMDKTSVPSWVVGYHWTLPSNQNTSSRLTRTWIDAARMRSVLGT